MSSINWFDAGILLFFSSLAREVELFDRSLVLFSRLDIFKGGVYITLLWWLWFRPPGTQLNTRQTIIATIAGAVLALALARTVAAITPLRLRPMHLHPSVLHFVTPTGMYHKLLKGWGSFPSDHAALFFALALGVFLVYRKAGVFALAYAALGISLPRIYIGLHYPTDILAGALLGLGCVWLLNRPKLQAAISAYPMRLLESRPGIFYAVFFFVSYQITTLFNDLRTIGDFAGKYLFP